MSKSSVISRCPATSSDVSGCDVPASDDGDVASRDAPAAGLAGRPIDSIVDAMKGFKEGRREATVMHQIAKGFSDAEIAALAAYFAAQKEAP